MDDESIEIAADALAELLYGLWQLEQDTQRIAADAATSSDEPASESEANHAGAQEPHHGHLHG